MPPTGVQWTSRPPRVRRHCGRRLHLRARRELGQRVGQPVRGLEAPRDDGEPLRPRAQQRRPGGARAAAGARRRGPARAPRGSAASSPSPSVRSPRGLPSPAKLSVLTAPASRASAPSLAAQREGGGLVRQRDVGAVEAERGEAADRRRQSAGATRSAT